jgi:hypothetical protein
MFSALNFRRGHHGNFPRCLEPELFEFEFVFFRGVNNMVLRMLELFSGTGSVGKVASDLGFSVVSLDRDLEATIKTYILDWDFRVFPPGSFDFIWASPPCTEYSRAKTTGVRKIEEANKIVARTLEIIEYYDPQYWVIENPQTGLLKDQHFMFDLPFNDIDYCKYGMKYRKRTRLWNNLTNWKPRELCKKDCGNVEGNRHIATAQRMPSGTKDTWGERPLFKQSELYVVPSALIVEILTSVL